MSFLFTGLIVWSRLCNWKEALVIVKPETLIGRHRKGFKLFWKGKSQASRPMFLHVLCVPYWPPKPEGRGHRRASPQNWSMFVRNHSQNIIVCDFLVVVTTQFRTLYVFSSWRLVRCASCIETSPRIQRQSGPYNSFAKRFRAIIRTVS
jgi:hypothetical protein